MRTFLLLFLLFLAASGPAWTQGRLPVRNFTPEEQLISIDGKTSFKQAMEIFANSFQRFEHRPLVYEGEEKALIGVNIEKMFWKDAFDLVLRLHNHWFVDNKEYVKVVQMHKDKGRDTSKVDAAKAIVTREVEISAVFFEANRTQLEQLGLDWTFQNTTPSLSAVVGNTTTPTMNYGFNANLHTYTSALDLRAIIKAMQSENLGELISCPSITVRSGIQGRIQVGQDFSVKQQDFSGNTIDKFYSAGTIIDVTPEIISKDSNEFVLLKISAERSSVIPDPVSTIVNKTVAQTSVMLINGEETVIGGLFSNEQQIIRRGVPLLKDLPWWVLGLRYIFGYDETQVVKKELIIILKANIIPSIEQRIARKLQEINGSGQQSLQNETERMETIRNDLLRQIEEARKKGGR